MPTRNIVPNSNNEGSLGTSAKQWAAGHFQSLKVNGFDVITADATSPVTSPVTFNTESNSATISGTGVTLDNGAKLQKGTADAGLGGNKGIALRCSVDYELKWEAGRLYIMEQDGFTIRRVEHCFTTPPTANDNVTKGFVVGSRWILDNGTVYECVSSNEEEADWVDATPNSLYLKAPNNTVFRIFIDNNGVLSSVEQFPPEN